MSAPAPDTRPLAFGELLADLRRRGFRIGVGHHLRLQEILSKAGAEAAPEDLKTLLCPLFATNQAEQEHFYRAFDNFFQLYQAAPPPAAPTRDAPDNALSFQPPQPPRRAARRKLLYVIGATLLVITALILAGRLLAPQQTNELIGVGPLQDNPAEKFTQLTGGASPTPDSLETGQATPLPARNPQPEPSLYERIRGTFRALRYFNGVPMFFIMTIAPLVVFLFYDQPPRSSRAGSKFRRHFNVVILWLVVITYIFRWYTSLYPFDSFGPTDESYGYFIDVTVLIFLLFLFFYRQPPHVSQNKSAAYERFRPIILCLAVLTSAAAFLYQAMNDLLVLFAPLIFFLIYEWHSRQRRRLVLQKQHGKKPPYVWPVRVKAFAPQLYEQDVFYDAARAMRRRQAGEHARLDVEATVSATVASLGYPSFRYRVSSRPPEYLVLIDRAGFRDHQAQLFNELAKALEREGVFVVRYFFDGDPRVCCDESGAGCLTLAELRSRFAGHRLLVFGDGVMLLDPVTGEVASWAALFAEWRDRALLTPRAAAEWGLREISLAGLFVLLPATLEGLLALVAHFESLAAGDVRSWRRASTEPAPPEFYEAAAATPPLVTELRAYLGERVFQWLAACAVYPELHWDLTLYLGSLHAMGGDLIREENLLRLIRLPWFRRGSIPDDVRWLLIRELDQDKERAVRAAIVELLEKNPPPAETYAADSYQLNLVVQRWLSRRDRRRQREALEALGAAPRHQLARDYTLMRFLESAPGPALSLLLPSRLRTLFYRHGIPAFGLKTGARLALTLAVALTGGTLHVWSRNDTAQSQTATAPAAPKVEAASYWIEAYDVPKQGDVQRVAEVAAPLQSGQHFKFHFTPRERGYLYIIGPGEKGNAPMTFLTAQGGWMLKTNEVAAGADFAFPFGEGQVLILDGQPGTEEYTFIFSRAPLSSPAFLTEKNQKQLSPAEVKELEVFRARNGANAPRLAARDMGAGRVVSVTVPEERVNEPLVFDVRITHLDQSQGYGLAKFPNEAGAGVDTPSNMAYVPGGVFMMGRDGGSDEAERPAHTVSMGPFFIDIYEVTNEEYRKFIDATGGKPPRDIGSGPARQPVTGVNWDQAAAFCGYSGKRLPTEEEWEFAARGTDGRLYPWGNEWRDGFANAHGARPGIADVGAFEGRSPFGLYDMVGNAWEWTASSMRAYPGGRLPSGLPQGDLKVIRGGSYESSKAYATTTYRSGWPARGAVTYDQTGFRCVKDAKP